MAQGIVAFCFQDEKYTRLALQAYDKIGYIVVRLSIVQIRNGKAQPSIFDKRPDSRVCIAGRQQKSCARHVSSIILF
jgi:hypothetical protein